MIIINRTFIFATTKIKKMIIKKSIRGLRFKIYHFNEYVIFIFYIKDVFFNSIRTFA